MGTDPEAEPLETPRIQTGSAAIGEGGPVVAPSAAPQGSRWRGALYAAVGPLWAPGLAAVLIAAFVCCFGLTSEKLEWDLYLCLGTLFPLLAFGLWAVGRRTGEGTATRVYRFVLGLATIVGIVWLWFVYGFPSDAWLTPVLALATLIGYGACLHFAATEKRAPLSQLVIAFLVSLFSWFGVIRCVFWMPFSQWLFVSWHTLPAFCLSLVLVTGAFFWRQEGKVKRCISVARRVAKFILCCFALAVFAALSLRTDSLFRGYSYHHWSFWIGPVESVREGSWLLWDTPSQYGFLSILLIAVMPIKSAWQSLYVVQAGLLWIVAVALYARLRRCGGGVFNYPFSLLVTATSVYLMAGEPETLCGAQEFMSVGAMRFVWCHLLLLALWVCLDRDSPRLRLLGWGGGALWVGGILWSAESAVYSTAIYGLTLGAVALQRAYEARSQHESASPMVYLLARTLGRTLMAPVLLLAIALGIVYSFYLIRLGHAPDWRGYFEYAMLYKQGSGALPINPDGPVWVLVTACGILACLAAAFLAKKPLHPSLALIMGAWGAVWAVSSYFVSRSHPNNVCNLLPILIMALAISLPTLRHLGTNSASVILKHAAIPIFSICIAAILGSPLLSTHTRDLWRNWRDVEERLPVSPDAVNTLLAGAPVNGEALLAYDYKNCLPARVTIDAPQGSQVKRLHSWLPQPLVVFRLVSEERRTLYLERWFERSCSSGWLIVESPASSSDAWLLKELEKTHTVEKAASVPPYTLYRCEVKR